MAKKLFITAIFFLIIGAAGASLAARPNAQKNVGEVKTEFFSIKMPSGWIMPQTVKKQPHDGGISVAFLNDSHNLSISLSVFKVASDGRDFAKDIASNMAKSGLRATEPAEQNGLWVMDIEGRAQGRAWFASRDNLTAMTLILGKDLSNANEFLKALKSSVKGLFPESVK